MKDNKPISGSILSTFELSIQGKLNTRCYGSSEASKSYGLVVSTLYKNGQTAHCSTFREKKPVDALLVWSVPEYVIIISPAYRLAATEATVPCHHIVVATVSLKWYVKYLVGVKESL